MNQDAQKKPEPQNKAKRDLSLARIIVAMSILFIGIWGLVYMLFWFEGETYSYKFGQMTGLKKNIFRIVCYDIAIGCVLAGTYFGFFYDEDA